MWALQALGHTVKPPPLQWWRRLRILRDTTRALVYLHTPTAGKPRTLHSDVKPANILLDDSLEACNRRGTRLWPYGHAPVTVGTRSQEHAPVITRRQHPTR